MIIELTKEQVEFLESNSSKVNDGKNNYYNIPYWFKIISENKFKVIKFEKLPKEIIESIKD